MAVERISNIDSAFNLKVLSEKRQYILHACNFLDYENSFDEV
jgi:hypothetical protein